MIKNFDEYEFNGNIYSFDVRVEIDEGGCKPTDGITPPEYDPFTISRLDLIGDMMVKHDDEWVPANDVQIFTVLDSLSTDNFQEML